MKLKTKTSLDDYLKCFTEECIFKIQDKQIENIYNQPIKYMIILYDLYDFSELDVELLNHFVKKYNLHGIKFNVNIDTLWVGYPQIILTARLN